MMRINNLIVFLFVMHAMACTNKKTTEQGSENNNAMENNLNKKEMYLLIGTYTSEGGSEGIYSYKFNSKTVSVDSVGMVEATNPSYLVISPNENFIYAVGESGDNSTVSAFSFDKENGALSHINTQPSGGADPCYIEIDSHGNNIITANYSGGSVSLFSIRGDGGLSSVNSVIKFDGSGPDKSRQASSHLHSVRFSPDGRFLFASDLGADKIYRFSSTESVFEGQPVINQSDILDIDAPEGTGPRHFDYHPSGKYMYLLGELSGEVVVYDYNNGNITEKQTIVSDSLNARGSGDIHVSPDGKFVYASNRLKGDGISIFLVDEDSGELSKIGYQLTGGHPRNFIITPDGSKLLVACRDDNIVQIFDVDKNTGLLTNTNKDIKVGMPVCLKLVAI